MGRIMACSLLVACIGCGRPAAPTAAPDHEPGAPPANGSQASNGLPAVGSATSVPDDAKGSPSAKPAQATLDAAEEAMDNDELAQAHEILDKVFAAEGPSRRGLLLKAQVLAAEGRTAIRTEPQLAVRKLEECLAAYDQVEKEFDPLSSGEARARAGVRYDLACSLSVAGEAEKGLAALKTAHKEGYDDVGYYEQDDDLKAVRALPEYAAFLKEAQEARREKIKAKVLAFEPIDVAFEVTDVAGKKIALADLKGKVVLIDCWATWCPPCLKMLPTMKELHAKHHDEGLEIIGLNFEGDEEEVAAKTVRDFLEKKPAPYPCAVAGDEIAEKLPPFAGIPTWFFVDRAGKIRYRTSGAQPAFDVETVIQVLLDEPADTP